MHDLTLFCLQHPPVFIVFSGIFGLIVGSFLNVVIYRLPRMLEAQWIEQCHELCQTPLNPKPEATVSLMLPASHCPACKKSLKWWHNIPLLSFIFLRGRCAFCQARIHWRYPLVEALSAMLCMGIALQYGCTTQTFYLFVLCLPLIAAAFIDWDHQFLPDIITIPLLWIGLLINLHHTFTPLPNAVIGAVAGYMSLWILVKTYALLMKKEGMGAGDFKLVALFGAWFGWLVLPFLIIFSSLMGVIYGGFLVLVCKHDRHAPFAFGPCIIFTGFALILFPQWVSLYLKIIGF